jgi:hypothetical protein
LLIQNKHGAHLVLLEPKLPILAVDHGDVESPPTIATTYKRCRNRSTLSRHQSRGPDYRRSDGRKMNVIGKKVKDSGSTRIIVRSSLVPMLENITASR